MEGCKINMRVITGSAKGRKLQPVPGDSTRPITDRAKEALFSILGQWIEGARVLDLFGGTGSVGIESLSRGAAYVHFVDLNRKAVETIRANLRHCRLEAEALVERADSFTVLKQYRGAPFDLIYVAPPQYQELWQKALLLIDSRPELLAADGEVVVQIHPREDAPVALHFLREYDRRQYGSVLLLFYAVAAELDAHALDDEADLEGDESDEEFMDESEDELDEAWEVEFDDDESDELNTNQNEIANR
jgi:16S rRNA (guanine966-N2)-methyltransferase